MIKSIASLLLVFVLTSPSCKKNRIDFDLSQSDGIQLNQIGFYPGMEKIAVITHKPTRNIFYVLDQESKEIVSSHQLSGPTKSLFSGKDIWIADFSELKKNGAFALAVPGVGKSHPFAIQDRVFKELGKGALKAFYFQRASTDLPSQFAGIWARPAGHPDNHVLVHSSAQSPKRKKGAVISAPFGWYDAGDYNKYIVNSGITMATLMSLYEDFPDYFSNLDLNIPESNQGAPDLLDEIKWNLEWMLKMQDQNDGGVYHKLTTANFEGMVMPDKAINPRYVVAKSTAAALDFAAVMAQASRVYKEIYPEMSISYLKAAESAWVWAKKNPEVLYDQNEMNQHHIPQINTGAYGDMNLSDEWIWAASELYISTHNHDFLTEIKSPEQFLLPSWNSVAWLGYYSLLRFREDLQSLPEELNNRIKTRLLLAADDYSKGALSSPYRIVMGNDIKDFRWGSNSVAANQGIALLQAYLLVGDSQYLKHALGNLDYIMGRNATGFSFVTGFGGKTPKNPHHRLSEAQSEKAPLPGFLVGGPNPGQQDKCKYPSDFPDESYVDETCSYASNEIAINWNAPLAYLANALEAVVSKDEK